MYFETLQTIVIAGCIPLPEITMNSMEYVCCNDYATFTLHINHYAVFAQRHVIIVVAVVYSGEYVLVMIININ